METISYHVEFKFTRENKINIVAGWSYKLCIKTLKMYFLPKVSVFSNLYYSIFVKIPQATFRSLKTINDCLESMRNLHFCTIFLRKMIL